jgi:hypothetical protein
MFQLLSISLIKGNRKPGMVLTWGDHLTRGAIPGDLALFIFHRKVECPRRACMEGTPSSWLSKAAL